MNQVNQDMQHRTPFPAPGNVPKTANLGSLPDGGLKFLNQVPPLGLLDFFISAGNE